MTLQEDSALQTVEQDGEDDAVLDSALVLSDAGRDWKAQILESI